MQSPYESWLESQNDHRVKFTQNEDYVRDKLGSDEFLLTNNRVNLGGGDYNTRRLIAESTPLVPHYYGNMDRFGWEEWLKNRDKITSNLAPNLKEENDRGTGGTYLDTTSKVQHRACSTCSRPRPRRTY